MLVIFHGKPGRFEVHIIEVFFLLSYSMMELVLGDNFKLFLQFELVKNRRKISFC